LSGRITLSTTDEAETLYKQLENDIENLYGGKSAFWRSCLMNFDDKSRIQAKIDLIEQRMEELEKKKEDLNLQKKGLEQELEEMTANEEEQVVDKDVEVDEKFWDKTMEKIFKRNGPEEPEDVRDRWDSWFEGRHRAFVNNYYELTTKEFKQEVLEKAEERGFEERVEKIRD